VVDLVGEGVLVQLDAEAGRGRQRQVAVHLAEGYLQATLAGDPAALLGERCIRPMAVGRRIGSGTRSREGTSVRMALASLSEALVARALN